MKPLAFTCGDPAGVGPEIIASWLVANPREAAGVAVIGPAKWLGQLPDGPVKVPVGLEEFSATPGQPDGEGALVAWAAMERAAAGCLSGEFSGVVTGPISKAALAKIGYPFPGQTEFFAARWGGEHLPFKISHLEYVLLGLLLVGGVRLNTRAGEKQNPS